MEVQLAKLTFGEITDGQEDENNFYRCLGAARSIRTHFGLILIYLGILKKNLFFS
jgi:hypothetical protein